MKRLHNETAAAIQQPGHRAENGIHRLFPQQGEVAHDDIRSALEGCLSDVFVCKDMEVAIARNSRLLDQFGDHIDSRDMDGSLSKCPCEPALAAPQIQHL